MVASLEAETTQFHARMTAAEAQLTKWTSSTHSGRRGTLMLQQGLQQLAFQAAGLPGPLGKVAAAIGMLGAGSGTVLVALAGIGAIAAAYRMAAKEAEALKVSTDKLNQSYRDIVAGGSPLVQLQNRIIAAVQAQADAQETFDQFSQVGPFGKTRKSPGEIALARNDLDAATRVVNALRALRPEMVQAAQLIAIMFQQGAQALAAALRTGPGALPAIPSQFRPPVFGSSYQPGLAGPATFENIRRNMPRFVPEPGTEYIEPTWTKYLTKAIKKGQTGFQMTPEFAIMSSMALLQGAQNGPAGLFGGAAGPLAMINPLAGAISAAVGGLFSLFDHKADERELAEERRHKELIGALHEGPMRVVNIFEGDPDQSLYQQRRQERLGGEPRNGGL
jgi:hypothetical protein